MLIDPALDHSEHFWNRGEKVMQTFGGSDEFIEICAGAGEAAAERGQYREALRLLHLGKKFEDVMLILCRCVSLPIWRDPKAGAIEEAQKLDADIDKFFGFYERTWERYNIPQIRWHVARRMYNVRRFHHFCDRGLPEVAVEIFDQAALLPLATTDYGMLSQVDQEEAVKAQYSGIVADYVRILQHAANQGVEAARPAGERVRQLLRFLAIHSHVVVLDQPCVQLLATLSPHT
jgi:hypothetical protein